MEKWWSKLNNFNDNLLNKDVMNIFAGVQQRSITYKLRTKLYILVLKSIFSLIKVYHI